MKNNTNTMAHLTLLSALLLNVGCGEDAEEKETEGTSTTTDTSTDTNTSLECSALSVDECASTETCVVIEARELIADENEECYTLAESQGVGCMDAGMSCGDAMVVATPLDDIDSVWQFNSTCIPEDWSEVFLDVNLDCEEEVDCRALSEDECSDYDSCLEIIGVPYEYSDAEQCYLEGDSESFGCMFADETCDEALVYAMQDSADLLVMFYDSCIPDDWATVDIFNFEVCETDEMDALGICEVNDSDPLEITALAIADDILQISVSYSGGCEDHAFSLCWDGLFMESAPVQVAIDLGHNSFNDACDAVVEETLSFDLSELSEAYFDAYGQSGDIMIQLSGQTITYSL